MGGLRAERPPPPAFQFLSPALAQLPEGARAAAVDIGSNSVRLLIAEAGAGDGEPAEAVRRERVTGLGSGVGERGRISREAMERTGAVLVEYGEAIRRLGAERVRAVATAAVRRAANREEFLERAAGWLGAPAECITGEEEGRLAFAGATSSHPRPERTTVVDIGGGSVEFITVDETVSADIGSVSLSERQLPDHPAGPERIIAAKMTIAALFNRHPPPAREQVTGVAGTWTSLASILVHPAPPDGTRLGLTDLLELIDRLAGMTLREKRELPGLNPDRAPVILGGAIAAAGALQALGRTEATVSARDLLDGVVRSLLAQPGG